MKLFELDATRQTKQAAKVFESYFGNSISFDLITRKQASSMLNRVRGLIAEHRSKPSFHTSEQNPSYMKLVVMEQGLAAKLREYTSPAAPGSASISASSTGGTVTADPNQLAANATLAKQQRNRQLQDEVAQLQKQINDKKREMSMPMAEARLRRIAESEVQQAQVVLASQDMVDQVQKMIEQVTAMQFKDLPALVDQVKNQIGADQAMQFNQDATGALTGLTQNLQGSKQQLEGALGVVTGQAPVVPGENMGAPAPELGAEELPPAPEGEEEIDVDLDADIEEPAVGATDLGRTRR
jgi:hypothetical protein